jgi:hypothetical protein
MTYNEFLVFLEQYKNLPSFAQKIRYANENLTRIGSGSGRIVYDIDGTKVFKIAKNTKGVAQNEVEIESSSYYTNKDIVAEVIESDEENGTWIVAEKGKKVNEKRIKQLTGIPSLNSLYYYLRNVENLRDGNREQFDLDKSVKEMLDENEFATELRDFIGNSYQRAGDLGRPSSYGEVVRNGESIIVLTDYGLDNDVYDTHYAPKGKHRMYELFGELNGNDDILSDIGNVGNEVRHGMWAIQPYSVSDGDGVINEDIMSFIENRSSYPKKTVNNIGHLADSFNECVNNLGYGLKKAKNRKTFYDNLISLQEYLISENYYDKEPLPKQLNEKADRNSTNKVANAVIKKYGYGEPKYISGGGFGHAYDIGDEKVLKVTTDKTEAIENLELLDKNPEYIAKPYAVYQVDSKTIPVQMYVIILEKLRTDKEYFSRMFKRLNYAMKLIFNNKYRNDFADVLIEITNQELNNSDYEMIDKYMKQNPEDSKFYNGMLNIINEIIKYGIESRDFTSANNLGYKNNGNLAYFDVGFGNPYTTSQVEPQRIEVNEDGTALYSTDGGNGDTGEPTYANGYYGNETELDAEQDSRMVNEEFLGRMDYSEDGNEDIEIFKNPNSISRLKGDIRGIITKDGDLYVANAKDMLHSILAKWLNNNIKTNFPIDWKTQYYCDFEMIPVQRYNATDKFYLGEMFEDETLYGNYDEIKNVLTKAEAKNPTINFIIGPIYATDTLPNGIREPEEVDIMAERLMTSMKGSSSVEVKDKCRLGGGTTCNQGDINNLKINNIQEEIDASEAYTDEGALDTVIKGKRNLCLITTYNDNQFINQLKQMNLNIIPIKQTNHNVGMSIVYNGDGINDAKKLEAYMKSKGGYVSDSSPEEARYIGKLLGYTSSSVEKYVNKRYGKGIANENNSSTFVAETENTNIETINEVEIMNLNIIEARLLM